MTGIFYGSTTGNTESLAKEIASALGVAQSDTYDVGSASPSDVSGYDVLLLGSSTWGMGDLQDDWYSFIEDLKKMDLTGKRVGLFGCGDSAAYPETFCDAIGIIHEQLRGSGCVFIAEMPAEDYSNKESKAFDGDKVLGLAIDDDEPGKDEARIRAWIGAVKAA